MTFEGALITEQRVTFAIVIVKPYVLTSSDRENVRSGYKRFFPTGIPIILMAQNSRGTPTYHGKPDIVKFLANLDFRRIPWKRYTTT